ncbi:hypothetical protein LK08_24250 [Streptomyces sp. MUSC 125]|nr:IclR family transcriptional regulator C-terminal domain-containing protein [Streptomyces sp. MUSC 125]KIE24554.1 hypothetical protein LK08_24250 [Streptomyces sp. MUSC 125]
MTAGDSGGGARVKSAVRTVELLEYFAGRPGMRTLLPETLPSLTGNTVTDREKLIGELHRVREQGLAVDHEENTLGLRCFGVAIPYRTPARDAVSCSVPVARLTPAHEQMIKGALFDARDRLAMATHRL